MKRRIIFVVSLFLVVLLSMLGWLLVSNKGHQLIINWSTGDNLKIGSFSGSLWSEIQLKNVEYTDKQQQLSIQQLQLHWQPKALFGRLLHIEKLLASDITYIVMEQSGKEKPSSLPALPLALQFDKVDFKTINLRQKGEATLIHRVAFKAASQGNTVNLSGIEANYLNHQLNGEASLSLDENYPFNASIYWQGAIPEIGSARANVQANGDMKAVNVRLASDSPYNISSHGQVMLHESNPILELQGDWSYFQWPMKTAAEITSQSGHFSLTGPLDKLNLNITTSLGFPQTTLPPVQTRLQGKLSFNGITDLLVDFQLEESHSRLTGELQWEPAVNWKLSLNTRDLNPSLLAEGFEGQINANAAVLGGIADKGLWLHADLQQLSGDLHGYPIKASAKVRYDKNGSLIEAFQVFNGPNSLEAKGVIADEMDLEFLLNAENLAASWPVLNGKLQANGKLTGNISAPGLSARIVGSDLIYQQHRINQVNADILWQQARADARMNISEFSLPGLHGNSLSMSIIGEPGQHDIQIMLDANELQLNASAKGNWQAPVWQGQVEQLTISQPDFGSWVNAKPVKLQASKDRFIVEHACFTRESTSLCSAIQLQETDTQITANLKDLPLKELLQPLNVDAEIEGNINGGLKLQGPLNALRGQADFKLEQGLVTVSAADEPLSLVLREGLADLQITPSNLNAELRLKAGDASIHASATTGPLKAGMNAHLKGSLKAEIPQISQISLLVPGLTQVDGRLALLADLKGTLDKPEVQGFLELENASATVPQLGLSLQKAHLIAKNHGTDRVTFEGDVTSGSGKLDLQGELLLDRSKGWPLKLSAEGTNVQLVRLPEAEIIASPNLDIQLSKNLLEINGSVLIPEASIEMRELPKQAVALSEDEEIISDNQVSKAADSLMVINTRVAINLGEKVSFEGFGLKTRIQGSVELLNSESTRLAQGQLLLKEGHYKAYGQDLTIEQGRLLFNGSPQNPRLDIKATRLSYDETVTAILNVSGSLQKPLVKVASSPALSDEAALSYLLTGRGLDEKGPDTVTMLRLAAASEGLDKSQQILDSFAAGAGIDEISLQEGSELEDTSLLLGKYLSPELYVSYAFGLFDNQGALITRYRLTERLRLEVQSGTAHSADLIYGVEK